MVGKEYLSYLSNMGYKYTKSDILFITKDSGDNVVWLEVGNQNSGFEHIVAHHKDDFANAFKVNANGLADYLYKIITDGILCERKPSKYHGGFECIYKYREELYTFVAMGNNGYIVTAFPTHCLGGEWDD